MGPVAHKIMVNEKGGPLVADHHSGILGLGCLGICQSMRKSWHIVFSSTTKTVVTGHFGSREA